MAIRSTFYDTIPGEGVKETSWAQSAQSRGPLYGVVGAGDLALTPHPTTPYAVNLSPGKFWGHGVWDESTGASLVQSVAPPSGVIWWTLIAARRDWQPTGGGPTSFVSIPGGSTATIPDGREKRPGIIDDQPLYLIKWKGGNPQPEEIIDLRCWVSNGGLEVVHKRALDYLETPGAAVKLGSDVWRCEYQGNGVWGWTDRVGSTAKLAIPLTQYFTPDPPREDALQQEAPSVYREGRRVHLSGVASNTSDLKLAGGTVYGLGLLPAGYRPAMPEYFLIEVAFQICRVWVRPDGNIYLMFPTDIGALPPRVGKLSLSGISFSAAS